jgi:hypothetical protein
MAIDSDDIDALEADLLESVANPSAIEGDMGSIQEHSLKDKLAVLDALKNRNAIATNGGRNIFKKIVPSGGTGVG